MFSTSFMLQHFHRRIDEILVIIFLKKELSLDLVVSMLFRPKNPNYIFQSARKYVLENMFLVDLLTEHWTYI